MEYTIPYEGEWVQFDDKRLSKWRKEGKADIAAALEDRAWQYEQRRCGYFLPHGAKWREHSRILDIGDAEMVLSASTYPEEWGNDGVAFLNDWTHDICLLLAMNQGGKSYLGAEWSILRTIPMKPEEEVFTKHRVQYHEWTGPKTWIIASYSWDNVGTIWKRYRELLPRTELTNYAPNWGKFEGERGPQRDLSFGSGRMSASMLQLACGTVYKFLCYTQQQMHWEGFESDGGHMDEQPREEQYVGLNRSFTTRRDYTPVALTLTGHVMEDRADTGAAGWVKKKLFDGVDTKGKTVGRYRIDIESVPDVIISKKRKRDLWHQWVDPKVQRSDKQQRAAAARYWGGWEEGSGLWIDIWSRRHHVVPALWADNAAPRDWTKWRVIDYGDNGVTCCMWFALGPKGYAFGYRMLYERGQTIAETCKLICEMSGSTRSSDGSYKSEETGNIYELYNERPGAEVYYATLLDSRACAQRQQGETLEEIFARYGIEVTPACGQKNAIQIPRLKDWLRLDMTKPHLTLRDEKGERVPGAARLMFFEGRCDALQEEMETCQRDKNDPSKARARSALHAIDCCKYWASDNPAYMGDSWRHDDQDDGLPKTNKQTKFTAY